MRERRSATRQALPLQPLLHAYVAAGVPSILELHRLPGLGPRFAAVLAASARFLYADFLDRAGEDRLVDVLGRFYSDVVSPVIHLPVLAKRAGFLRHALNHLLHGRDTVPRKLQACLSGAGTYRVPGLGPAFWSALMQGLSPGRYPGWTRLTRLGLERLGLVPLSPGAGPVEVYTAFLQTHARIRAVQPQLTSLHIDHLLSLIALMPGRNLRDAREILASCPVQSALTRLRTQHPLRQRLKERGLALASAQQRLEAGLQSNDGKALGDALSMADPISASRSGVDCGRHAETLTLWIGRLWESDDPYALLARFWHEDPIPGAGLWLPGAVLHLRDPQRFLPFGDLIRAGHAHLDDGVDPSDSAVDRYRLLEQLGYWLREQHGVHPLEVPDLLSLTGKGTEHVSPSQNRYPSVPTAFHGFCADTFHFLGELQRQNQRTWMEQQRDRYHFVVREPLTELCRCLAERYVEPVLKGRHGWNLDTSSRTGRALTSVCRNVFGKSNPYTSTLWITFCPPVEARAGVQLFVCLSPTGLRYGLRLGKTARQAREWLRQGVRRYSRAILELLRQNNTLEHCRFGPADDADQAVASEADLLSWAEGRSQEVSCTRTADDPLVHSEDLLGDVLLTFDRLLCLFACAIEADPGTAILRCGGVIEGENPSAYSENHFRQETSLGDPWLQCSLSLLKLKKQLILQGVPGTGKTHVARCLARLITGGQDDACRLIQFHPAYSYEEFVEGIRVRTVNLDGRHEVTYPVEDGLLCAFAALAASRPAQPHVLIIDEINRGNLPRIFGELLYLLEYRGQAVELPYSRRAFSLPANLYLVGTMNGTDRSIAQVDLALRRRFSFVQMDPDRDVLAEWLRKHLPDGSKLGERVLTLFDRLNTRLHKEVGPHAQIGHSYFMVPEMDEERLRMIWQHHIRPLLDEFLIGQPGRATSYEVLLDGETTRNRSTKLSGIRSGSSVE